MKAQATKGKAIIPAGTYVPSNWSPEERRKQVALNTRNTMASREEVAARHGTAKATNPARPK